MRILWISNILMPEAEEQLGILPTVAGGWMIGMLNELRKQNISIGVLSVAQVEGVKCFSKNNVEYFVLPIKASKQDWSYVDNKFDPELIHIHGTEYSHGIKYVDLFPERKFVVSIQGLVSVCSRYYLGGLKFREILKNISFRDIVFGNLYNKQKDFVKRGDIEKQYIKKCGNVIGRTNWDRYHTYFINKDVNYFFCNESLRSKFYTAEKWNQSKVDKYSIFLSQASYPLKGVHQLIKAVSLIKDEFPNLKVYIGGYNIVQDKSFLGYLKLIGYGKILREYIKKYELQNNIIFTGNLTESKMIDYYQNANVFICSSSIENSSNSIGEAQLIGTPVIASFVGGIEQMVEHNKTGLIYRFEEFEMLAYLIKKIFENDSLASDLSENGIKQAKNRHNKILNVNNTLKIYEEIINK